MQESIEPSFKKTITIEYKAGLLSSNMLFSDQRDNEYFITFDTYGITLDRNGKSIFKGHPYLDCYFYNILAKRLSATQKVPDIMEFSGLGTLKINSEYKQKQKNVREIIFNDQTFAFIQYKNRLFRSPSQYVINVVSASSIAVDVSLFCFSYIHNKIAGRNSS